MAYAAQELQTPVTMEQVNAQLTARVQVAERAVRAGVPDAQLTQAHFSRGRFGAYRPPTSLRCVLPLVALTACAENRASPPAPSPNEVLAELSRRSAVPETELKQRLENCDADQQSLYFCAFRDSIAVDLQLDRTAAEQAQRHPDCKAPFEHHVRDLKQQRDSACARSAAQEYGAGSMVQTAIALCASSATQQLIHQVAAMDRCPPTQSQAQ